MTDLLLPIFTRHSSDPWAAMEANLAVVDHLNGLLCACGAEKPANDFECNGCFLDHDDAMRRVDDL